MVSTVYIRRGELMVAQQSLAYCINEYLIISKIQDKFD